MSTDLAIWGASNGTFDSIIRDVQNREVTPSDQNWIDWQASRIGNRETTFRQVRDDLIDWSGERNVIDQIYNNTLGRPASADEANTVLRAMHDGRRAEDVTWSLAHNAEASTIIDTITGIVIGGGIYPYPEIRNALEDELGHQSLTISQVKDLFTPMDVLVGPDRPYTIAHAPSPHSHLYTDGSGTTFFMSNDVTYQDALNAGHKFFEDHRQYNLLKNLYDYKSVIKSLSGDIGQGGKLDIQRDTQNIISYSDMQQSANYLVGIYCYAAGLSQNEMMFAGYVYGLTHGTPTKDLFGIDVRFWKQGWTDAANGRFKGDVFSLPPRLTSCG